MSVSDSELTPLMVAARSGDLVSIERLLAAGVEREATCTSKAPFTALYQAVLHEQRDAAMLLASTDMSTEQTKQHVDLLFGLCFDLEHKSGPRRSTSATKEPVATPSTVRYEPCKLAEDVAIRLLSARLLLQECAGDERCVLAWLERASESRMFRLVTHIVHSLGLPCPIKDFGSLETCLWTLVDSSTEEATDADAPCHSALNALLSRVPLSAADHFVVTLIKVVFLTSIPVLRCLFDSFPSLMATGDAKLAFQNTIHRLVDGDPVNFYNSEDAFLDEFQQLLQILRVWLEEGATATPPAPDAVRGARRRFHPLSIVLKTLLNDRQTYRNVHARILATLAMWLYFDGAWDERQSNVALFSRVADLLPSISKVLYSPPSLQHICTRTIRRQLHPPFRYSTTHLPVPPRMQNYITGGYLDVCKDFVEAITQEALAMPPAPVVSDLSLTLQMEQALRHHSSPSNE